MRRYHRALFQVIDRETNARTADRIAECLPDAYHYSRNKFMSILSPVLATRSHVHAEWSCERLTRRRHSQTPRASTNVLRILNAAFESSSVCVGFFVSTLSKHLSWWNNSSTDHTNQHGHAWRQRVVTSRRWCIHRQLTSRARFQSTRRQRRRVAYWWRIITTNGHYLASDRREVESRL